MKIQKKDTVIITSGKDRGKSGTVLRAFPKKNLVLVEGINMITHHEKSKRRGQQGQIVVRPEPIHVSNVSVKHGKGTMGVRVGYTTEGEGKSAKKVRVARPSGEKI